MILVWLGELITENGIGNGISIIIFGGIVSRIPQFIQQGYTASTTGGSGAGIVSIAVFLADRPDHHRGYRLRLPGPEARAD